MIFSCMWLCKRLERFNLGLSKLKAEVEIDLRGMNYLHAGDCDPLGWFVLLRALPSQSLLKQANKQKTQLTNIISPSVLRQKAF